MREIKRERERERERKRELAEGDIYQFRIGSDRIKIELLSSGGKAIRDGKACLPINASPASGLK